MLRKKIVAILAIWTLLFFVAGTVNANAVEKIKDSVITARQGFSLLSESTTNLILSGGGGSSGSTGGKGVVTCENLSNILKYQTLTGDIRKNTITSFAFQNFSIFKLYANGKEDADIVSVRMELISGPSSCIKDDVPIPGDTYQYINIWIGEPVIKELNAKLRLDKTAFIGSDIGVYQWNKTNKEWVQLNITSVGSDINYDYFDFMVNGEGNFAIVKIKQISVPVTIPSPTIVTLAPINSGTGTTYGSWILLLIVLLLIECVVLIHKKKKDK